MINLLPDKEKKEISGEYKLRVVVVSLMAVLMLIIFAGVLLVPSYILALYKENSAEQALSITTVRPETADNAAITAKIQSTKLTQDMLRPDATRTVPSTFISMVVKDKGLGNSITSVSFTKVGKDPFVLTVRGVAQSRKSLTDFQHALQSEQGIGSVNVPLSDFIKDSNIDYTMDIHGK